MMGSYWRDAMQEVAAVIDETMGEPVTVTPVDFANTKVNFPKVMLPGQAVTVTAVFTSPARTLDMTPKGKGQSFQTGQHITTDKPSFGFRNGMLPFEAHQGMQIAVCRTGEIFEVTNVLPDAVSRIVCEVVQLGRRSGARDNA